MAVSTQRLELGTDMPAALYSHARDSHAAAEQSRGRAVARAETGVRVGIIGDPALSIANCTPIVGRHVDAVT